MVFAACVWPVSAAGSDSPPVRRCARCSPSTWSAAAGGKAAAAGSAHWCSDKPNQHRGASPAARTPEEQESRWVCVQEVSLANGHRLVKCNTVPGHSSSAAHAHGSSSLPPSAAGASLVPLCTLTRTTVVHKPDANRGHTDGAYYRFSGIFCCTVSPVGTDLGGRLIRLLFETLNQLLTVSYFSLLLLKWKVKSSASAQVKWELLQGFCPDLCELVHRALQQDSGPLSLVSLPLEQTQLLLHLQQPRLSLLHGQLQLQRRGSTVIYKCCPATSLMISTCKWTLMWWRKNVCGWLSKVQLIEKTETLTGRRGWMCCWDSVERKQMRQRQKCTPPFLFCAVAP